MNIVPSAEIPPVELRCPQLDSPVVASLPKNPPARRLGLRCDVIRAHERALFHHLNVWTAGLLHAQDELDQRAINRDNVDLVPPIARPDLNVFSELAALLDV